MAFKIYLYDDEYSCIGTGALASSYLQYKLQEAQGQDVDVHISSMGGSHFDAVSMYLLLIAYNGKVRTIVDSLAASAAATVFMAGSERLISKYGLLMIHKPTTATGGTSQDMAADIKMLDKVEETIINIYADKTGIDVETIKTMVGVTTWMNAEEALEMKFATSIVEPEEVSSAVVTNHLVINKSFNKVPNKYQTIINKILNEENEEMKTDTALIEKNNSLFDKVLNFFKKATIETVTNKGKIKSFAPLNIGVSVSNDADEDLENDDYEVDNNGVKTTYNVKDGKVMSMKTDATEPDAENVAVLNRVGIVVTNKAEAPGIAKVVLGYESRIVENHALIADLSEQLRVSNELVKRDETEIRATIQSDYVPNGSSRSHKITTEAVNSFTPKSQKAQAAVKISMGAKSIGS